MINKEKFYIICDRVAEICLLAIVFFVPLYFSFLKVNYNIFDLSKAVVFRFFLLFAFLALLGKITLSGKVSFRFDKKIFLFSGLLLVSYFFSSLFSAAPQTAFWGNPLREMGFYSFACFLLFFLLLLLVFDSEKKVRRLIVTILVTAAAASLYGAVQYLGLDPVRWREPFFLTQRIFSSFGQPNFFAAYLLLVLPVSLYALFFLTRNLIWRVLIGIAIIVQLLCLFLAYSRAAWLGVLIGTLVFSVAFIYLKSGKISRRLWVPVVLIFSLAVIIIGATTLRSKGYNFFIYRTKSIFDTNTGSNRMRLNYWSSVLVGFDKFSWREKLFGLGPEAQWNFFTAHYQPNWGVHEKINTLPDRAHSSFFDTLLQFGLFGLLAAVCLNFYIFWRSLLYIRKKKQTGVDVESWFVVLLLSGWIAFFISDLLGFLVVATGVQWFILSALLILSVSSDRTEETCELNILSGKTGGVIFFSTSAILIFFFYAIDVKTMSADYYYMQENIAETNGDCKSALDKLSSMLLSNPGLAFYKARSIAHYNNCFPAITSKRDRENLAKNILDQIETLDARELNYFNRLDIARAYALLGYYYDPKYYPLAEKKYRELISQNPSLTLAYDGLGQALIYEKKFDQAIEVVSQAIGVVPPLNSAGLNYLHQWDLRRESYQLEKLLGDAYFGKNDLKNALKHYEAAAHQNPFVVEIYKLIADTYYRDGNFDQAITYISKGLRLAPTDYNWNFNLALLLKEKGDQERALFFARAALKLSPDNQAINRLIDDLIKNR